MPDRANVSSVEAIAAFRTNLLVYLSKARPALEEIGSDVMRQRLWLTGDRRTHWDAQVKRCLRKLEEAQSALFSAKMSNLRDASAAEQSAVHRARHALADAEEKIKRIKLWDRDYENSTDPLLRQLEKLNNLYAQEMPNAAAYLAEIIGTLDAYANILPAAGSLANSLPFSGGATDAADAGSAGKEKP